METNHLTPSLESLNAVPPSGGYGLVPHDLEREKDAVRIQAAAVAAQQAALTEEEARLHQRQLALEQQENQLAAHLEDKRQQLMRLRDEARQARDELQRERQAHEQHMGTAQMELTRGRQELDESKRLCEAERNRLVQLRRHLKKRWHRHWMAQRQAQQRREVELVGARQALAAQQAALVQARLQVNGERELGRRKLWDGWDQLGQAQEEFRDCQAAQRERGRQLDRRAAELVQAAGALEEQKQQWQRSRLHLEMEAEGLDNRIRNYRRKLAEREVGLQRSAPSPVSGAEAPAASGERETASGETHGERFALDVSALEVLSADLADQRLHLAEQWERLLQVREHWQEEHDNAVREFESLVLHLREQEQTNRVRDYILTTGEHTLRQRLDDVLHLRLHLEGCQARLRSRVIAWEGERDRLLLDVKVREESAERRLEAVAGLRERWDKRRRQELNRFQSGLAAADRLRQEYAALREEWFRRNELLEHRERELAEKGLALEQYQQECIGQSADSPAAEKRLGRLRRHWAGLSQAAERNLRRERQTFRAEMVRCEERNQLIEKLAQELASQEAKLASRQTASEHDQAHVQARLDQMTRDLQSLHGQRQRAELQLSELRDEVEHVARLLMEENDLAMVPAIVKAA